MNTHLLILYGLFQWTLCDSGDNDFDDRQRRPTEHEFDGNNAPIHINLTHNVIKKSYLRGSRWNLDKVKSGVIQVYFSMEILDISKISPTHGEFRIDFNLKQRWHNNATIMPLDLFKTTDPESTSVTVGGEILLDLWTPDAYIPNSRDAQIEDLTFPQRTVTIFKNKTIVYTSNMYTVNGCPMKFYWYPMETQRCFFLLESYSYTNTTVNFNWDEATTVRNPITFLKTFKLRQYALTLPPAYGRTSIHRFGRNEAYSRLYVVFTFDRQLGHFILQNFMPTTFIVCLSWFSFWLGMDAIPARVSLLVTCMLTLVTLYTGQKADVPSVSYVKMIDVWMTACLAFVFAAMFEFIIVRYLAKDEIVPEEDKLLKAKSENQLLYYNELYKKKMENLPVNKEMQLIESRFGQASMSPWTTSIYNELFLSGKSHAKNNLDSTADSVWNRANINSTENVESTTRSLDPPKPKNQNNRKKTWYQIDRVARIAFPVLFFCFCLIFWPLLIYGQPNQTGID